MIYRHVGPTTRKFLFGDHVRFCSSDEYRIHEGHAGQIFKIRIFKGPGDRHQIRYGTECECGATLWPIAPRLKFIERPPYDAPDLSETIWDARARYLLRTVGVPEKDRISLAQQISTLTDRLSARESEIVLNRRGLSDAQNTLQQIADRIGVSRARVHQIEQRAIEKLRRGA